jgi:hypothetical protein
VVLGTRGRTHVAVRLGGGDGSFGAARNYRVQAFNPSLVVADVNHDQIVDVVAGSEGLSVMLGNGNGTFRRGWRSPDYESDFEVAEVAAGDFNADGNLDLLAAGDQGEDSSLLLGRGDGRFQTYGVGEDEPELDLVSVSVSAVAADFNGDGRLDLALVAPCESEVGCNYGAVVFWLNWTGLPAKPCVVPQLSGYFPIGGVLRDYGCRLGRVAHRYSRKVARGYAISQNPKPDTVLPSFSKVDVVVSRGRRHPRGRS